MIMVSFDNIYKVLVDNPNIVDTNVDFVQRVLAFGIDKDKAPVYKYAAEQVISLRDAIHPFIDNEVDAYIVGVIGVYIYAYIQCELAD
jgi:hypothetical protein